LKKLGWWIIARTLKAFCLFVRIIPERFLLKLGDGLGILASCILTQRRKTGFENIRKVFGPKISKPEAKALIKANFKIYLIDLFRQWRDQAGIGFIPYKPRRVCVSESLKVLRNNGIIFLQIDQNPRKNHGVDVEFFGYQVPTYSGPVVMAFRTGAAIVPLFIHRDDNNTETITILTEVSLKRSKDRNQDIVDNLRAINKLCEDWIKKYPEQWWWIHRRFRRAREW